MAELQTLVRLQQVDTALDAARRELEQVESQLGESAELVAAREGLAAVQRQLRDAQHQARELEYRIQELTGKIATDEGRLYGGKVSTRDLDALQREIEHLRQQRAKLEDDLLVQMEQVEQLQRGQEEAGQTVAARQRQWEADQAELIARRDTLRQLVAERDAQRTQIAAQVSAPTLAIYEELRHSRRGLAVVPVERNTCRGCRIAVPTSVVTQARLGRAIVRCPSCGRILVVER